MKILTEKKTRYNLKLLTEKSFIYYLEGYPETTEFKTYRIIYTEEGIPSTIITWKKWKMGKKNKIIYIE